MAVTQNTYTGNGSTVLYSFTFPYLNNTDVKASLDGTDTTEFTFSNATTLQFNSAPANGAAIRIYRVTTDTVTPATFYAGSAIRAKDLNDNFTQNLYVTQEDRNEASTAVATANTAKAASDTSTTKSDAAKLATDRLVATTSNGGTTWTLTGNNTNASTDPKGVGYAVTTAESAKTAGDAAKLATDTYVHDGTSLKGDGVGGNPQGVAYAVNQAAASVVTSNSANTTAGNANTTANQASSRVTTYVHDGTNPQGDGVGSNPKGLAYAINTSDSATTTANTASTNASTAISTANTASTNASNAVSTANTASTNANAAVATANAASSAVADAVIFTPKADKAALESFTPSADGYYEVTNTTNLANGTWVYSSVTYTLANIPGTFQGATYLGMKLSYTHSNKTFTYMSYNASDPENRYIANTRPFGGTTTFTVKVATKNSFHRYNGTGASNGFTIDGEQAPFLTFTPGRTYKFDQSDSSNSGHPLVFYEEADKTTQYATNITTNGTPGSAGAYTQIVTSDNLPTILHYQCSNHTYMGNAVQCNTAFDRTALAIIDAGNFDTSSSTASMTNTYDGGSFD